ncbi:Ulp1 protease family, carboxy-terminal domain protein [Arachis hypogaea]|nr:Ulp1 protease family, carboxy-terminal domain protein [Arachis hypogaea]
MYDEGVRVGRRNSWRHRERWISFKKLKFESVDIGNDQFLCTVWCLLSSHLSPSHDLDIPFLDKHFLPLRLLRGITMDAPRESHLPAEEDGLVSSPLSPSCKHTAGDAHNRNLNLELATDVSAHGAEKAVQKNDVNSDDAHNEMLPMILATVERIEARSVVLNELLMMVERKATTNRRDQVVPSHMPNTEGAGTRFWNVAGTVQASVGACNIPSMRVQIDLKIQSYTHQINPQDKGKGKVEDGPGYMWDVIVPNSPGYDDDVIIDESLSTPRPVPPVPSAFNELPNSDQLDCTSLVSELFSLSPKPGRATKHAKIEPSEGVIVCSDPSMVVPTAPNLSAIPRNDSTTPVRRGSGQRIRRPGLISRADSPIFLIPMSFEMFFDPTADMDLTMEECRIAAYIFGKTDNYGKILFKFYELEVPRAQLHSLCPKHSPHPDIVNIIVMMASLKATREIPPRVWLLPSPFADDVLRLKPLDVVVRAYLCRWMPATTQLEKVIIPIYEVPDSWYIMVLNVKEGKVYCLDVTKSDETVERRERNMRTIMITLSQIFRQEQNVGSFTHIVPDPTMWGPIEYPKNAPTVHNNGDVAVWCLHWLQQDANFDVRNIGVMISGKVWMKTATTIVMSEWNQKKKAVESSAMGLWRNLLCVQD